MIALTGLLAPAEVGAIRDATQKLEFGDGRATAGRRAGGQGQRPGPASPPRDAILEKVRRALIAHPVFLAAARPQKLTPLLLSRYRVGRTYGLHVDDALRGASGPTSASRCSCRTPPPTRAARWRSRTTSPRAR